MPEGFSLKTTFQQLKKYEIGFVLILKTLHVYGCKTLVEN